MSLGSTDRFPSTHWSLVRRAGDDEEAVRHAALAELLRRYLKPLRMHLTSRRGIEPSLADDLIQEFVVNRIFENELLSRADPKRGRFRAFLATSLDRFVSNRRREALAQKRMPTTSLETLEEPLENGPSADRTFDIAWAREVLGTALRRMQGECEQGGRADVWAVFDARVVCATLGRGEPESYESLAGRLGIASEKDAANLLVTGKRMFVRALRSVVGEYECTEAEIDAEIDELWALLAR